MRRRALAPLILAMALAIGSETPIILTAVLTAQVPSGPALELSARSDAARARMDEAARLAILRYTEWLGAPPFDRLAIADAGPFLDSRGQMRVESRVAQHIARAWFARIAGNDAWKDGAAAYLQSLVVERLFDHAFFTNGYRYEGACFFGCRVPWSFQSLPLSRWRAVDDPLALAFASLERELGWPTLQGALRAAASGDNPDPVAAMSDATGRDLAPVFAAASGAAPIDHAVAGWSSISGSCAVPCFRTEVTVAANGAVPFPLPLRVSFADGRWIETRWDGRRDRFEFESASPAIEARLDPDAALLLDRNPLNNVRVQPRDTNVPLTKWMARWILWLQDAMLTQTFPV